MAKTMHTNMSIWTLDEKIEKWYGLCVECKGEKAKHTPKVLKNKKLKPCSICTNMEAYDKHNAEAVIDPSKKEGATKADIEHAEKLAKQNKENEKNNALREIDAYDSNMVKLKVGDKIRFCSACYQDKEEKVHGQILEITKYHFKPEKTDSKKSEDSYAEQEVTRFYVKVKDFIGNETFLTHAGDTEKV